ncbi:MAG TPA: hypothetical protein VER04_27815 [Polyangiaceae bacterium]|nr:hypothetical protein [Polyangiaceae bacterium]
MRHRYPFEAVHWLREQRVDREARVLGERAQRAARAHAEALRAEAARLSTEQRLSALSAAEHVRLSEGLSRAGDLQAAFDWQKGAAIELLAEAERERQAREVHASEAAAEVAARRALATASSEAKTIDAHRDAFRAERARAQELSEEEAVAEQWTASHFPSRRS